MGLRTYPTALETADEHNFHARRKRYLNMNVSDTSHDRLFGDPDTNSIKSKRNYMKSDVLGVGFGPETSSQQKMQKSMETDSEGANTGETDDIDSNATTMGDNETDEDARHEVEQEQMEEDYQPESNGNGDVNSGSTAASVDGGADSNSANNIPTSNARENGGNPITGAGYRQEIPHRRRQFTQFQYGTGFW